MTRLALLLSTVAVVSGARAAEPLGIASCDAFLTAYERCAASPGVPEAVLPGLRDGIASMREGYRSAAAQSPVARDTIGRQCSQTHNLVRQRLVEAFKCDFPAADLASSGK